MRVSAKMIRNMVETFNKYHDISINGRPHQLMVERGINGYEVAWLDKENHTIPAHVSPSTAMSAWETYLVIKTLTDGEIYREQAKLTIRRNY